MNHRSVTKLILSTLVVFLGAVPAGCAAGPEANAALTEQPLPSDFRQKHSLEEIKRIAKERNYNLMRLDRPIDKSKSGTVLVQMGDVLYDLLQSDQVEDVETGVDIKIASGKDERQLHVASMVASTHKPTFVRDFILKMLKTNKYPELAKALIQEAVLRGANFDSVPEIASYWAGLNRANNRLSWLPLHSADVESGVTFPHYYGAGSNFGFASMSQNDLDVRPPIKKKAVPKPPQKIVGTQRARQIVFKRLPFSTESAKNAFRSWEKSEIQLFASEQVLTATDISADNLLKLKLACLAGAKASEITIKPITPKDVFSNLFSVASSGGPYGGGQYAAYGRLDAWRTIIMLSGADGDCDFKQAKQALSACKWYSLSAKSSWFFNIAWDMGIICVRPDGKHMLVLAATAED